MNPLRLVAALLLSSLFVFASNAFAEWPDKPLKIIVPFAPGGQPDVVARAIAEPLSKALAQPIIIENKPGAGGNIAADFVAKAAPDGYTLLIGTNGPLAVSPALSRNLPYDPAKDLAPVTLVGTSPNLIAVNPSLGVNSVKELVTKAKAEPGKLNFGSVGKGSISQLTMELLNSTAGIQTVHIPYQGGAPATTALIAGDVQLLSLNPTALIPQVKAGKVKVIAQTSAKRSALVGDVPTVAESGYPDFEAEVWMAFMAPAKTPAPVIARLSVELTKIIKSAEMKTKLFDTQMIDAVGASPEATARVIAAERDKWARVGKATNLSLD